MSRENNKNLINENINDTKNLFEIGFNNDININSIAENNLNNNISINENKNEIENPNNPNDPNEKHNEIIYFKNDLNYNINKNGFYLRLALLSTGIIFLIVNIFTNIFVTTLVSQEGIKDYLEINLIYYTNFLIDSQNNFSIFVKYAISIIYDCLLTVGIIVWIIKSKSSRTLFTTISSFLLMIILQNIFLLQVPYFQNEGYTNTINNQVGVNSLFLTFPANPNSYISGKIGFILICILEFHEHELYSLLICGIIYLINLILYLIAIHDTMTLSVMSTFISVLYFDMMGRKSFLNKFDIFDYLLNLNSTCNYKDNIKENEEGIIDNNNINNDENNEEDEVLFIKKDYKNEKINEKILIV